MRIMATFVCFLDEAYDGSAFSSLENCDGRPSPTQMYRSLRTPLVCWPQNLLCAFPPCPPLCLLVRLRPLPWPCPPELFCPWGDIVELGSLVMCSIQKLLVYELRIFWEYLRIISKWPFRITWCIYLSVLINFPQLISWRFLFWIPILNSIMLKYIWN